MLSPIQRWLANPSLSRWEQPSYEALRGLQQGSATLRKRQALYLWSKVFSIRKEVSALSWAKIYATQARMIIKACPDVFQNVGQLSIEDQWLHYFFYYSSSAENTLVRRVAAEKSVPLLRQLGHENVLSQALVETVLPFNEQVEFWRHAFPHDPMHEHMNVALGIQAVRRKTLDGYLRARKYYRIHEYNEQYDLVDLTILGDD